MRLPLPVFRAVSCCADFRDVRRLLFGEWYQLDVDDVTTRTLRYDRRNERAIASL